MVGFYRVRTRPTAWHRSDGPATLHAGANLRDGRNALIPVNSMNVLGGIIKSCRPFYNPCWNAIAVNVCGAGFERTLGKNEEAKATERQRNFRDGRTTQQKKNRRPQRQVLLMVTPTRQRRVSVDIPDKTVHLPVIVRQAVQIDFSAL